MRHLSTPRLQFCLTCGAICSQPVPSHTKCAVVSYSIPPFTLMSYFGNRLTVTRSVPLSVCLLSTLHPLYLSTSILCHLTTWCFALFSPSFLCHTFDDETYRHCYPIELPAVIAVVVLAIGSFTNRDYHSAIKSPSIRLITFGLALVTHWQTVHLQHLSCSAIQWQWKEEKREAK